MVAPSHRAPAEPAFIDLRSDTVTQPTDEMREAMRTARVGNSAWGEDPTVRELEERSASVLGKEAALFVPSGTMGNQAALRVWTSRRLNPEVILEHRSHIFVYESAGLAGISGAQARPVPGVRGAMAPEVVEAAINDAEYLKPATSLVCVEETHNLAGGAVVPLSNLKAIHAVAETHGLPVHMDGARIFNAATALACDPTEIARHAESVMFCFSKGLCAPIGSVVAGERAFVRDLERARALLGGAMRQAGVVAAAALVGLDTMRHRLNEDHENARLLGRGLAKVDGLRLDPVEVQTNIVIFDVAAVGLTAQAFIDKNRSRGILYDWVGPTLVRAVTHRDVTRADVERALDEASALFE